MSLPQSVKAVGSSRMTNWLLQRPQLVMTLLLLVTLVALQGGAAATDLGDCGEYCLEPMGGDDNTNKGP